MGKGFLIFLLALWSSPDINQENRLPMRASLETGFETISLDGEWDFLYDGKVKGSMPVPGMWELNGCGDPVYICNNYAWRGHYVNNPPYPPVKDNHEGIYRRTFCWDGPSGDEDVVLRIGAVTSNVRVLLNGDYVGYSEDSKLSADFDITDKLRNGENLLELQVRRWCDGTYLEDQDFWRMTGISRSVEIIRRPVTRLEDLQVMASASGRLGLKMLFAGKVGKVSILLRSPQGRIWRWRETPVGDTLQVVRMIPNPRLWSAETPALYDLEITVCDAVGKITQMAKTAVGFRDVAVKGTQLLVNGKPVLIKGVNRHEMTALRGYCITKEEMEEDVRQLKLLNINAVRTSHYPNDPYWYVLCDRYGLYVMDEANIESHGIGYKADETLADKPDWALAHRERFRRMVQRDRNHPCVIMWSLANEAGMGANHARNYDWARSEDPTRPSVYQILKPENRDLPYTDIEFYHYRSPEFCEQYLTDGRQSRPFMLQEYAHAMGNSLGGFKEYWDLIRKYPGFQGGFIWDFADQALLVRDSIKIGGDFNSHDPWNASLHCNGLLSTDRQWHPHAWEAKYQMRNILISASREELVEGRLTVRSEFFFKKLEGALLKWAVLIDGNVKKEGVRRFGIGPQEEKILQMGYSARSLKKICPDLSEHDVRLQLSVCLGADDGILKKGDEIAWEDLELFRAEKPAFPSSGSRPASWSVSFDGSGFPSSLTAGGVDFLAGTIRPCFGRAITENDKGAGLDGKMRVWLYPDYKLEKLEVSGDMLQTEGGWTCRGEGSLSAVYSVADVGKLEMVWTVSDNGKLHLSEHLTCLPQTPPPFRVGVEFPMPGHFCTLDYFGAGPFETYADRKSAARIARYTQRVSEQYHSGYVRPQESGNHTDLRYMALRSGDGSCLVLQAAGLFSGSALSYSREALDISVHEPGSIHHPEPLTWRKHFHSQDLVPDGLTHVHADLVQMGVGGIDSWKSTPLKPYMLEAGEYTFSLTLSPELAN